MNISGKVWAAHKVIFARTLLRVLGDVRFVVNFSPRRQRSRSHIHSYLFDLQNQVKYVKK